MAGKNAQWDAKITAASIDGVENLTLININNMQLFDLLVEIREMAIYVCANFIVAFMNISIWIAWKHLISVIIAN